MNVLPIQLTMEASLILATVLISIASAYLGQESLYNGAFFIKNICAEAVYVRTKASNILPQVMLGNQLYCEIMLKHLDVGVISNLEARRT